MKGTVLLFDHISNKGVIVDKKQNQYHFHIGEWLSAVPIKVGQKVVFEIPKEEAFNIQVRKKQRFLDFFLKFGNFFNSYRK